MRQAIYRAIYDRRNSWHAKSLPEEAISTGDIESALSDFNRWSAILGQDVAKEIEAKASNGRGYWLSILPLRHFAIRYYAVMCFAPHAAGLWHSRLGRDYLSCSGIHSLFLGRVRENTDSYKAWQINQRSRFVLKFDIRGFYQSIRHDFLVEQLTALCSVGNAETQRMLRLLPTILRYPYRSTSEQQIKHCEIGLPIGNTTERFFSNLYLSSVDVYLLDQRKVTSCRRLDDIRVFADDATHLQDIREGLADKLERLGMSVNVEKTKILRRSTTNPSLT